MIFFIKFSYKAKSYLDDTAISTTWYGQCSVAVWHEAWLSAAASNVITQGLPAPFTRHRWLAQNGNERWRIAGVIFFLVESRDCSPCEANGNVFTVTEQSKKWLSLAAVFSFASIFSVASCKLHFESLFALHDVYIVFCLFRFICCRWLIADLVVLQN